MSAGRAAGARPGARRRTAALGHPNFVIGSALTAAFVLAALVSLAWTPFDPAAQDIPGRLQPPGGGHLLGTDLYGRDTLSLLMAGAATSVTVGLIAVGLGAGVGVPLGLAAVMWRERWPDDAIGRAVDLLFAFPTLLSATLLTALAGPGAGTAILAIGLFNVAVFARVTRAAASTVAAREFVRAAQAMGRSRPAIALVHLLPNAAGAILVQATIQFAVAILAEAGLSYLGLGVQPPTPSWGKMLFDAQTLMFLAPMQAVWPGLAIALAVLGLNLLGDGLRDALDPKLKPIRSA
jgi:peptide/nickel transport system permease protein